MPVTWAQTRGDLDPKRFTIRTVPALLKKRVKYDMIYVAKWSLLLDCRILVDTAIQIIFPPRTAY